MDLLYFKRLGNDMGKKVSMKILFITNSLGFAGAEKMLVFVANELAKRGHACYIANLNNAPDYVNARRQVVDDKVVVYDLIKDEINGNKNHYTIKWLVNIVKNHQVNIVIGFTNFPNMYAKIVGLLTHIPSIMSERGDPSRTNGINSFKDFIALTLINRCSGGVFQTEGAKKYYGRKLQKRGVVIPNPVYIDEKECGVCNTEKEKTIVSVGRLDNTQKRYDIMLQAFELFHHKHPEYILKLYGKGEDEELIKKWVHKMELDDAVKFMGLTASPMREIASDDIFLITSDYEGISNSLLEAMAIGMPCVSTDHSPGGARLLIRDHDNGLLAPIQDVNRIASCLCEYVENPALKYQCSVEARNVLKRFSPSCIINKWENYLYSMI